MGTGKDAYENRQARVQAEHERWERDNARKVEADLALAEQEAALRDVISGAIETGSADHCAHIARAAIASRGAALIRLAEQEAEKRMVWSLERHESEGDTVLARYPTKPTAAALRRDIPSALSDEDIARLLVADPEFRATATCSFISETVEGTFSDYSLWAVAFDDPIDSAALASRGAAHG